jgi:trigger factor
MQVIEKNTDGLRREFNVVIAAASIEEKVEARLNEVSRQVRLPGFRPGKVPMDLLRKRFGQSVRGEVLERTIDESTQAALSEKAVKPALQPKVELVSFDEGKDLEFAIKVEVLPEISASDFSALALTRDVAKVSDKEIDEAVETLRRSRSTTEPVTEARGAEKGDVVIADFVGRIDGTAFDGGTAQGASIDIGSGTFIPGFEEQIIGIKAGETKDIKVTFPADYPSEALAGKEAVFEIKATELRRRVIPELNDEFAKGLGVEDVNAIREKARESIQQQLDSLSRLRLKRRLLDKLAETHSFAVPDGMVQAEFDQIWRQVEQAKASGQLDASDAGKSDDELRAEYRSIAERRVRLGLLLSDVGQKNSLTVSPEDFSQAIMQEARRYPGQESAIVNHYQRNPQALESLRAPIFEEKVVDFIISKAQITETPVSVEELQRDPDAA